MTRHLSPIGLILLSAILAPAATITQSVTCNTRDRNGNGTTVRGTNTCNLLADGAVAQANSYYDVRINGNELYFSIGSYILAGAANVGSNGSAGASIAYSLQLGSLSGPLQSAFVAGFPSIGQISNGASSTASYSFVPAFPPSYPRSSEPILVQLGGNPFTIYASAAAQGGAGYSDEAAGGGPGVFILLRFYEQDGVTPIALAEVPEPGTSKLAVLDLGFAIAAGIVFRKRLTHSD